MKTGTWRRAWAWAGVMSFCAASLALAGPAPESVHLGRAKDYIAGEQWTRAIAELQLAAADPKEPNRDEALFWLAHSEHAAGDQAAAIQTIARLEHDFQSSRWVRPAQSLRIEIAQSMRRDDFLWRMAVPAPPPPPPGPAPRGPRSLAPPTAATPFAPPPPIAPPPAAPASTAPQRVPASPRLPALPGEASVPQTPIPTTPPSPGPVPAARARPAGWAPIAPFATTPPPAGDFWTPAAMAPDTDLRIEALGGLMDAHADRVIPLLKEIALDRSQPDEAGRAIFVLAQSSRPEARNVVAEVALHGSEPARLVAVRELGHFDGSAVTAELLDVYANASPRIKRQVVSSLGDRADTTALLKIAKGEPDTIVRNSAIMTLARTSAHTQLRLLYVEAPRDSRSAVLSALLTARDEDGLIRIAGSEKEPALRLRARQQLRLLGTPGALKFLADNPE